MEKPMLERGGQETSLRGGGKSSRNMEQLVLQPELLQEQLRILANGLPMQDGLSISDLFGQTYQVDPLSNKILKAI
jgi:hypothetical protein